MEGRVGGLLSPVPRAPRDVVVTFAFTLEDPPVVGGGGRLVVMERRFGGMPFLGGDFNTVLDGLV